MQRLGERGIIVYSRRGLSLVERQAETLAHGLLIDFVRVAVAGLVRPRVEE